MPHQQPLARQKSRESHKLSKNDRFRPDIYPTRLPYRGPVLEILTRHCHKLSPIPSKDLTRFTCDWWFQDITWTSLTSLWTAPSLYRATLLPSRSEQFGGTISKQDVKACQECCALFHVAQEQFRTTDWLDPGTRSGPKMKNRLLCGRECWIAWVRTPKYVRRIPDPGSWWMVCRSPLPHVMGSLPYRVRYTVDDHHSYESCALLAMGGKSKPPYL